VRMSRSSSTIRIVEGLSITAIIRIYDKTGGSICIAVYMPTGAKHMDTKCPAGEIPWLQF
jgi:hypothetical protein